MVNFEDFKKIELKVAKITKAEDVEGSDNLLKIEIDLGETKTQIVSGIKQFYSADMLIGKEIVVVTNLEPRLIFGLKSQGMLLAADDNGNPVLLIPDKEVSPGSRVT